MQMSLDVLMWAPDIAVHIWADVSSSLLAEMKVGGEVASEWSVAQVEWEY